MIKDFIKKIEKIKSGALDELEKIQHHDEIERFYNTYLGRKGRLNEIFKEFELLGEKGRKEVGKIANTAKKEVISCFVVFSGKFKDKETSSYFFDETIPGKTKEFGTIHPITQFIDKITAIFTSMGFEIVEDREVETTEYNFDKLNIEENHPARDMWDTFYIMSNVKAQMSNVVLRTHTSPVQLRAMETRKPPVRLVVPGRVYRHEATDASHETNFYQLEGLVIDKGISFANLRYVVDAVLKGIFGEAVKTRIRPSYFPFVEPGHEVDMSCIICVGNGCSVCGRTGWLEMMGAGMVHPYVLKEMGVDKTIYTGFAFGMGIDRLMMLMYGVDDIRLSYSGDLRFLKQF